LRVRKARRWAAACALALGACSADRSGGYSFSSGFRMDVRTVSAPVFENKTYDHGVEAALTEAIVKEIQRVTPYAVTSGSADTTLSGVVTLVHLRQLTTSSESGLGQEMAVEIAVDFEWRDNRSGRTLLRRRNFRASATFVPALGVGERMEIGRQGAVESLAQQVVDELRSDW
jgi:hypothetical protein